MAAVLASYAGVDVREMLSLGETEMVASTGRSEAVRVTGFVSVPPTISGMSEWLGSHNRSVAKYLGHIVSLLETAVGHETRSYTMQERHFCSAAEGVCIATKSHETTGTKGLKTSLTGVECEHCFPVVHGRRCFFRVPCCGAAPRRPMAPLKAWMSCPRMPLTSCTPILRLVRWWRLVSRLTTRPSTHWSVPPQPWSVRWRCS
eukprot:1049420-Lingulodinium_polyedra.AAC.1